MIRIIRFVSIRPRRNHLRFIIGQTDRGERTLPAGVVEDAFFHGERGIGVDGGRVEGLLVEELSEDL